MNASTQTPKENAFTFSLNENYVHMCLSIYLKALIEKFTECEMQPLCRYECRIHPAISHQLLSVQDLIYLGRGLTVK